MRKIVFEIEAFDEYFDWAKENKKLFEKITKLIVESRRNPFDGTGKPEPLKNELSGCWSRRIDEKHRLVYLVSDEAITIISCRNHYFDK